MTYVPSSGTMVGTWCCMLVQQSWVVELSCIMIFCNCLLLSWYDNGHVVVILLQFDPSRWSESQAALDSKTGSQRFVPFSIGPKACAGQQLALMELKVMLVMLLAAFEFKLASNMG